MGEALPVNFDRRSKPEFHGSKVTSDAGVLAYQQLDEALDEAPTKGRLGQPDRVLAGLPSASRPPQGP
jgi:hypothetical protein